MMSDIEDQYELIGLPAINSVDFVAKAIQFLNDGVPFFVDKQNVATLYPEKINVLRTEQLEKKGGWYSGPEYVAIESEDIALVNFTSGTEGNPKAVFISCRALADTTDRLIKVMELDQDIREYIGVPVYHSFGFGRCRAITAVGGKFFVPENGFDPIQISEMLLGNEINSLAAVPSLLRVILECEYLFEEAGKNLKWIEIGSQYMSSEEKIKFKKLFPNAIIVQHYGLTEASRSSFLRIDLVVDKRLESVGEAIFGVEIALNKNKEIKIKGNHLASFYIKDNQFFSISDREGAFTTKDLGRIENGFLYYEGRTDDIINCGGVKVSPEHIENEIRAKGGFSKGFSVVGVDDQILGQLPKVAIEENIDKDRLVSVFCDLLLDYGIKINKNESFLVCKKLPSTDTGKVQRKQIQQLFKEQTTIVIDNSSNSLERDLEEKLVDIWEATLAIRPVRAGDNFFDLGGDSLSAIRVSLAMEKAGLEPSICRLVFKGRSISEIVKEASAPSEAEPAILSHSGLSSGNLALNFMRGVLVIINIAAHWMPGVVERLPTFFQRLNTYFAPLYSSGTPGFAVLFGAGVGFYIFPRYQKNRSSIVALIRRNAFILSIGVTALAIVRVTELYATQGSVSSIDISNSTWSVITFYLFAVISIPVWFWILEMVPGSFAMKSLLLSAILYCFHIVIDHTHIPASTNPLIQPLVLLMTAKFNYFELMAGTFLGAYFGYGLRHTILNGQSQSRFAFIGAASVVFGIILSVEFDHFHLWFKWPKGLVIWSWFFYFGCVVLLTVIVLKLINERPWFRDNFLVHLVSIFGVMAFPLFIAHEMVIPVKGVIEAFGVPLALPLTMSLFLALTVYGFMRLDRLYRS